MCTGSTGYRWAPTWAPVTVCTGSADDLPATRLWPRQPCALVRWLPALKKMLHAQTLFWVHAQEHSQKHCLQGCNRVIQNPLVTVCDPTSWAPVFVCIGSAGYRLGPCLRPCAPPPLITALAPAGAPVIVSTGSAPGHPLGPRQPCAPGPLVTTWVPEKGLLRSQVLLGPHSLFGLYISLFFGPCK